jgi:hypothetical protein
MDPGFSSLSDKALDTVSVFASETSVSMGNRLVHEGGRLASGQQSNRDERTR